MTYPTQEELEAMAHRTATRYRHGDDCPYQFAAHCLQDFARRIIDWHTAKLLAQEPLDLDDMAHSAYEEAMSFGISHDLFLRYFKTVAGRPTPAAPAVPEKIKKIEPGFKGMFAKEAQAYKRGWNECRGAMLNAAPQHEEAKSAEQDTAKDKTLKLAREALSMAQTYVSGEGSDEELNEVLEALAAIDALGEKE